MKSFILISVFSLLSGFIHAQSILGRWQLIKQTDCMEDEIAADGSEDLIKDMKSMSGTTPQVLTFKENNSGEENTKIINKRKSYNSKGFLYKFDGQALYILDKKSRTIIEGFTVEKFKADSLIISNTARACETKVFVKIGQ